MPKLILLFYLIIYGILLLISLSEAFGFGGGCGCPCMPQPCIPQPPPIALPSLCFPQIQLPCPPPSCGCCGRRKRESGASALLTAVSTKSGIKRIGEEKNHCNNPHIKRIILKNLIIGDLVGTRNAIYSELRAKLGGNYIINCAHAPSFAYSGDSVIDYCVDGHQAITCAVFKIQ
uniref:Putative esophageal gland cell secretory protein 3 n=1 Tax=Meloidogyne incognita TaxID=6306 RepID=A0A914M9B6_MELIC